MWTHFGYVKARVDTLTISHINYSCVMTRKSRFKVIRLRCVSTRWQQFTAIHHTARPETSVQSRNCEIGDSSKAVHHTESHGHRSKDTTSRYPKVWRDCKVMKQSSNVSRYKKSNKRSSSGVSMSNSQCEISLRTAPYDLRQKRYLTALD